MSRGVRTVQQRWTSLTVKIDPEVVAEAERLCRLGRMSRDAYVNLALRHYNRFHALTRDGRVRTAKGSRVVPLFPEPPRRERPKKPKKRRSSPR
ncbi:MAG: hypothetical protein KatS3mg076_2768 [Candidatus Binatia bacterium]|nr:MAG: hypothetical protein KatS3mg076_2768 [Candidatus Binatia bacterium]